MVTRTADAEWTGDGPTGHGQVHLGSGAFDGPYDFRSRMQNGQGTNPEELIGAAHAGCFSMALSFALTQAGRKPERIKTHAIVHFEQSGGGFSIPRIELQTEASVPGLDAAAFQRHAEDAKKNCPVSKALAGVQIDLTAKLV
jgi:lipoyl-dependent peroxiredoxin